MMDRLDFLELQIKAYERTLSKAKYPERIRAILKDLHQEYAEEQVERGIKTL